MSTAVMQQEIDHLRARLAEVERERDAEKDHSRHVEKAYGEWRDRAHAAEAELERLRDVHEGYREEMVRSMQYDAARIASLEAALGEIDWIDTQDASRDLAWIKDRVRVVLSSAQETGGGDRQWVSCRVCDSVSAPADEVPGMVPWTCELCAATPPASAEEKPLLRCARYVRGVVCGRTFNHDGECGEEAKS